MTGLWKLSFWISPSLRLPLWRSRQLELISVQQAQATQNSQRLWCSTRTQAASMPWPLAAMQGHSTLEASITGSTCYRLQWPSSAFWPVWIHQGKGLYPVILPWVPENVTLENLAMSSAFTAPTLWRAILIVRRCWVNLAGPSSGGQNHLSIPVSPTLVH